MFGAENIGLSVIRKLTDIFSSARADSLVEYTSVTRVEPIAIVDSSVIHYEGLSTIMQSLQSIFAGYWLQAFSISMTVGKIEVLRHLDKLNPSRNPMNSAADTAGWLLSMESYTHSLPMANQQRSAMEADFVEQILKNAENDPKTKEGTTVDRNTFATVKEMSDLSQGKLLSVEVIDGEKKVTIPVAIRLMVSSLPTANLLHILSAGNKNTTLKERWHAWKSGRLEFFRDMVMCRDLIDAHRDNLLNDKSGLYNEIMARRKSNKLSTILSGNPSVATASNIVVTSQETIERLQGDTGLDFTNFRDREKIFKDSYLMIVAVVDTQWDRVSIYYHSIPKPTQVSLKDMKSSNKGSGPDVAEILKAYQLGQPASL